MRTAASTAPQPTASGDYRFSAIPAGVGTVDVTDPAGHALTTGNDPQGVTFSAGASVATSDVGFQGRGTVAGHVFVDTNGNGGQNGGEADFAGVTVTVTDAFGGTALRPPRTAAGTIRSRPYRSARCRST